MKHENQKNQKPGNNAKNIKLPEEPIIPSEIGEYTAAMKYEQDARKNEQSENKNIGKNRARIKHSVVILEDELKKIQ